MNATSRTTRYNISLKIFAFFFWQLTTKFRSSLIRDDTCTSDSSPESNLKDCKTSKRASVKNCKKAQPSEKIARTELTKFAKKISLCLVYKGM